MSVVTSRNKQNICRKKLGSCYCVVFPLSNKRVSAYRKPRMHLSSHIKYKLQGEYYILMIELELVVNFILSSDF